MGFFTEAGVFQVECWWEGCGAHGGRRWLQGTAEEAAQLLTEHLHAIHGLDLRQMSTSPVFAVELPIDGERTVNIAEVRKVNTPRCPRVAWHITEADRRFLRGLKIEIEPAKANV